MSEQFPPRQRFLELNNIPLALTLGGFHADVLHWGFIANDWWRNYLHVHSFFEICYAFAGRGEFRICGERYEVKAGDVFIARPDEPHEIIANKKSRSRFISGRTRCFLPNARRTRVTLTHCSALF